MRCMAALVAAITLVAGASAAWGAEFPYGRFTPGSLTAYAQDLSESSRVIPETSKGVINVDASLNALKLRVTYTGESRPIPAEKAKFISDLHVSLRIDEAHLRLYTREFRFVENGRSFWLPVQTPVSNYFAEELKPGELVDLYGICAGGFGNRLALEPVILIEEFEVLAKS
jgi:hypothetical protein